MMLRLTRWMQDFLLMDQCRGMNVSEQVRYSTGNNLKQCGDIAFNPLNEGILFRISGSVLIRNFTENGHTSRNKISGICRICTKANG